MSNFERIKYYYEKGWAKKPHLLKYVQYNVITPAEYKAITGEEYDISEV
ncbi:MULTISPECIES: XkdX family protein [Cohnella]|nr:MULTISPECIES: XkdX family protein [Cohnella]MBN2981976.1 XkdX family protein [Cohnella algarum]